MKIFATVAAICMAASQAFAGSYQQKCETTSVPYTETVKADPGQVVGGAVIGGVIGKVVTKENAGAAAGAIVGGAIANEKGKKTVTRYKQVRSCRTVYVPSRITDAQRLRRDLLDLNDGRSLSKEETMDAQYTIGVTPDGKWGPQSRQTGNEYLARLQTNTPSPSVNGQTYSLVVNNVVITSSTDAGEIDKMKNALQRAGVNSQVTVAMQ